MEHISDASVRLSAVMIYAGWFILSLVAAAQASPSYVPSDLRHGFHGAYFTDMSHGYVFGGSPSMPAFGDNSIIATDDGGSTWRLVGQVGIAPVFFLDGQTFWIWDADGSLKRTTDGGITFTSYNRPTFIDLAKQAKFPICGKLFFLTAADGWSICGSSVLTTNDGGRSWGAKLLPPALRGGYVQIHMFDAQDGIAVGSSEPVIRTTDGGHTWTVVSGAPGPDRLSCTSGGFCAGLGGLHGPVFVSADQGLSWRDIHIPLQQPDRDEIYSIQAISPGTVVAAGCDVGFSPSTDLAPYIGKRVLVPTFGPELALILDWDGTSWTRITHSDLKSFSGGYFVDADNGWLAGMDNNLVFKTNDGGRTLQFVPDYFRQIAALTPTPTPLVLPTPTP